MYDPDELRATLFDVAKGRLLAQVEGGDADEWADEAMVILGLTLTDAQEAEVLAVATAMQDALWRYVDHLDMATIDPNQQGD